ncbi:PfkB family carbohydrate kinase [Microbacterium sp.]|uniref:PfkB family carbohydrate kinase n=1 Tax=Microbacterium sp. TaxID=51671 RepID=UPI002615806C|nr:PfkB family carbohydrate kinase [Microbacterium sp.]
MSSVVVIGDALIDELRDDTGVKEFVGGAALNVAVGLSRLGVPTTLIAMVGDDEAGAKIRAYLDDYGVQLLASPSPLGSSRAVSVRVNGEPTYAFNDAAKARHLTFDEAQRAAIADADRIVVSCYPFDDAEQTASLADAVGAASDRLVIDPNPRTGMMKDLDEFRRGFETLADGAGVVKIGDDDATLLYETDLDAAVARMRELGVPTVLATRGAAGATLVTDEATVSKPVSTLPGAVVDTMGAGDASLAALVAGIVQQDPTSADEWTDVLADAMDIAAATCRFPGALLRTPKALAADDMDRVGT